MNTLLKWIVICVCAAWSTCIQAEPAAVSGDTGQWRVGPASDPDCQFQHIQGAIDATFADDGGFAQIDVRVAGDASLHLGNTYLIDFADFNNVSTFRIIGGHASCGEDSPSEEVTVLDADGEGRVFGLFYLAEDNDPVRRVELLNLEVRGGRVLFGPGGGIGIGGHTGRQQVHLSNVRVIDNLAMSGAGVFMVAEPAVEAELPWVSITRGDAPPGSLLFMGNRATGLSGNLDGGAIACFNGTGERNAPITLFEPTLFGNSAADDGGGLSVRGCTGVEINMASREDTSGSSGLLSNNGAGSHGGGISVADGGEVVVRNSDPAQAATIHANSAGFGGGVYASGEGSRLELDHAVISINSAEESGGGIYVADGAEVVMGRFATFPDVSPSACKSPFFLDACSRIMFNHAKGHGGAIAVEDGGRLRLAQTFVQNNSSDALGSVALVRHPGSELLMEGAVISGNHGSSRLFQLEDRSLTSVDWSTIAGNPDPEHTVQVFRMLNSDDQVDNTRLRVRGSIVWEPGAVMLNRTGPTFPTARCVIGHLSLEDSNFSPGSQFYSHANPGLRDPEAGDLRLRDDSPAIDYCSTGNANFVPEFGDMFDNPRGVPHQPLERGNGDFNPGNGIFDIGAHEVQPVVDEVFEDRFEAR